MSPSSLSFKGIWFGGPGPGTQIFSVSAPGSRPSAPITLDPCFFLSHEGVRSDLKKLPALPTQVLKEHPSLAYW